MQIFLVDTNALLRFLLKDIPKQSAKVRKLFQQAKQNKVRVIIPQQVIFEVEYALSKFYEYERDFIAEAIETIIDSLYLTVEGKEIFQAALPLYKIHKLSFVDCFLVSFAKSVDGRVFTFDKALQKLSATTTS